MARGTKPASYYREAVKTLRAVARGFGAGDGFNLRDSSTWTPSQKRRITQYDHELQGLNAQPRYVYKTRNKADLAKAQRAVQSETNLKWKVAFIPFVPQKTSKGKVSQAKPRITFTDTGIRIRQRGYHKSIISLDSEELALAPKRTIAAAIKDNAPQATRFTVRAGPNEMPGMDDKKFIADRVIKLMMQYDGKKALPRGSGNKGDAPKHHKWDQWLTGIVAYTFPRTTQKAVATAAGEFDSARRALQKERRNARVKARRKAAKK